MPATSVHYTTNCNTQSSVPEDGQNNLPKHVELPGIINKPLLLHLVGCLYYLYQWCLVKQISDNDIYLLIKYIKSVLWRVAKCLSYIEDARCLTVSRMQPAGHKLLLPRGVLCIAMLLHCWKYGTESAVCGIWGCQGDGSSGFHVQRCDAVRFVR